jgi:hypothetical protein
MVVFDAFGESGHDEEHTLIVDYRIARQKLQSLRYAMRRLFRKTGLFVDDAAAGLGLLSAIVFGPATPTSEMLVVPTYLTIIGVIIGIVFAAKVHPLWIPVGILAGGSLGFLYGLLARGRFYHLHKFR